MQFKSGTQVWTWDRCYGRDGRPVPTELNENVMAQYANNVELALDMLPKRRAGSASIDPSNGVGGTPFKFGRFFGKWEPAAAPIDEYLFWSTGSFSGFSWMRLTDAPTRTNTTTTSAQTPPDSFTFGAQDACFCQFNNKMYYAASGSVDRLHVVDPLENNILIRRVGVKAPTAPTVNNQGTGTYSGFRYYRIQYKTINNSRTRRQSNLGTPQGFTPSGAGAYVRVFIPAADFPTPTEMPITHFVVWASTDNALYYNISGDVLISTSGGGWDDSIPPADYANYPPAPEEGAYNSWPSVKYLLAGIDRLIGFGGFGGTGGGTDNQIGNKSTAGRVWFSSVLGTTTLDDDERVPVVLAGGNPIQNWIDVGRGMGESDRGLGGPIDGNVLVFQSRGIYLLVPTGNVYAPFKRVTISTDIGAIECTIFTGQDEIGRPAVYWLDENAGPFRYGANGLQWLGYDVRDEFLQFNRTAPEYGRAHGIFHTDTQTAYFWITQGTTLGSGTPNRLLCFNARLGKDTGPTGIRFGWTTHDGRFATASGSIAARRSALVGTVANSALFQPVIGVVGAQQILIRDPQIMTDAGFGFSGLVRSKVIDLSGASFQVRQLVTDWLYVQAVRANVDVGVALYRNFTDQLIPPAAVRNLSPPLQGAETRVLIRYEGLSVQDCYALQVQIGDVATTPAAAFSIDAVTMPIEVRTQERWNTSA